MVYVFFSMLTILTISIYGIEIFLLFLKKIIVFFLRHSLAWTASEFGYRGSDTVQAQECDSYEILEEIPKPLTRNISESGYSIPPIGANQYVWPGHPYTCTKEQLVNETNAIYQNFCKASPTLTQEDLYSHSAGVRQFNGNDDFVRYAKRYKFRFYINTRYSTAHWTAIYAPPGELITIEIPPKAVGKLGVNLNRQAEPGADYNNRLDKVNCYFSLWSTTNKFGWPYGGHIEITAAIDLFNAGFDVNITGGIRMPYFRYGVTTDQEWEEELSKLPGPLFVADTGAQTFIMPSQEVRNVIKINDAMVYYRGVSRILYSVNDVTYYPRRRDGRVVTPIQINLDTFVRAGAAFSVKGANYIQMPTSWSAGVVNFDVIRWGQWGHIHEIGHQFQSNWGWGSYGEVTNNVFNYIHYSMMTEIDSTRQVTLSGEFNVYNGGWGRFCHQYNTINEDSLLIWYANNLYWFGQETWRKALYAHIHRTMFPRNDVYPYVSEYLLHLSKISNRDMRAYFKTFSLYDYDTDITQETHELLNSWNLKEFHPIALLYQTGYEIDGKEFETAKPWRIPARENYIFDFIKYKKTRHGMHTFTFKEIEGGNGTFEYIDEGKFIYKPNPDSQLDKFKVVYVDDVNGDITKCIITVKQIYTGCKVSMMKLDQNYDIFTAYSKLEENINDKIIWLDERMTVPSTGSAPWIAVSEGCYFPTKTSPYKFIIIHDEDCLFYFSENPLTGNQTLDAEYLVANLGGFETYYNKNQNSKWLNLEKDKKYYFRLVIKNSDGTGSGSVGFITSEDDFVRLIQKERVKFNNATLDDEDKYKWQPIFENDPTLGNYYDSMFLKYDPQKFKVISHPKLYTEGSNLTELLFDYNIGRQDTVVIGEFPLTYVIDFVDKLRFNKLYIPSQNRRLKGKIEISFDGKYYNTYDFDSNSIPTIVFDKVIHCQILNITILSNYYGKHCGIVDIQPVLHDFVNTVNIIPATHSKINVTGDAKLTSSGIYYNGKGYKMKEGSNMTIMIELNETGNCIGIIGDRSYYSGMFEVYLDHKYDGFCNTSFLIYEHTSQMITDTIYQTPLYGIHDLKPNSKHIINIVCTKGEISISGFLMNGNFIDIDESFNFTEIEENEENEEIGENSEIFETSSSSSSSIESEYVEEFSQSYISSLSSSSSSSYSEEEEISSEFIEKESFSSYVDISPTQNNTANLLSSNNQKRSNGKVLIITVSVVGFTIVCIVAIVIIRAIVKGI